ncbi:MULTISPECIES: DoxX family membrane protein [Chryseobacterium]|uniref:DoxX family membrane protein n=1 Tax=Chryseobacterium TaxID=59732 RepID=UPI001294F108|nr:MULTISPECIES: DoxX family membrane protein [Chryseobacterium]MDR6921968.1 putative membrane protein YphA (DoxX/SURF4 family) [Chryseobacterium sp. 2987]
MTEKKQKLWDYFILCARVLLAWILLGYGWSKLTEGQFGISAEEMAIPVKDLGLFKLSWYLFAQEPFKTFVGISQIIAGLLFLYNRTAILGALIAIPILLNILVIDITYVKMTGFYWRLSYYLLLDFLILWHYKDRMITAFKAIFMGLTTQFKYPFWAYLILPIMAVGLEILGILPRMITGLIVNPSETLESFGKILEFIKK